MSILHSHPTLHLIDHVAQVQLAEDVILARHHPSGIIPSREWLHRAATLHDAGKSSQMFQEYIADPEHYRGDRDLKRHTPLSLILTLLYSAAQSWDPLETLAVALAVRGHHGQLPTLPDSYGLEPLDPHRITSSENSEILEAQMPTLDPAAMTAALGLDAASILHGTPKTLMRQAKKHLNRILEHWHALSLQDQLAFRLRTQFLFSVLLEADKALLAIQHERDYVTIPEHHWNPRWVDDEITRRTRGHHATQDIRRAVRTTVMTTLEQHGSHGRLFSLTAPTGIGKTFLAASWALTLREARLRRGGPAPQIIVVLPFLSIIDQTIADYRAVLQGVSTADPTWLLPMHSLADRHYDQTLEPGEESFFIDTWRSDVIVTTYDQFLLALFDDRARYQMRFHHLADALLILDEVQALPPRLWCPLQSALEGLTTLSHTQALLMSATLPAIFPHTVPLLPDYHQVFRGFSRYTLQVDLTPRTLDAFIDSVTARLPEWIRTRQRVLLTLNTRGSARKVRQAIADAWPGNRPPAIFFITADVTPRHRRANIDAIKRAKSDNAPCVVVSTQTVEAGVDLDMTHVIRDFAPWDSLVQIAGRCNREWLRPRETVEIYYLHSANHQSYAGMVYDPIRLSITHQILAGHSAIPEEDTLIHSQAYFDHLATHANTGQDYLTQYIQFRPRQEFVRELLRGPQRKEYHFMVLDQDPHLQRDMDAVRAISDRWARREAWRRLAPRLAEVTIHVTATWNFNPKFIGVPITDDLWILNPGHYSREQGLLIEGETLIF